MVHERFPVKTGQAMVRSVQPWRAKLEAQWNGAPRPIFPKRCAARHWGLVYHGSTRSVLVMEVCGDEHSVIS